MFQLYFLIDDQQISYSRQVQTLSGIFGEIGGLMGIITIVAAVLLGWFQENEFYMSLITSLVVNPEGADGAE